MNMSKSRDIQAKMPSPKVIYARACLKNHFRNLQAPLCSIFYPHSVAVARYAALIRIKSPTNRDSQLTKSLFQTRSSKCNNTSCRARFLILLSDRQLAFYYFLASSSKNRSPYFSYFASPTPDTSSMEARSVGFFTHISINVLSLNTIYGGTFCSSAIVRRS